MVVGAENPEFRCGKNLRLILLHDIGKTVELSGPVVPSYTFEGQMLGHISIAQSMVYAAAKELNIEGEELAGVFGGNSLLETISSTAISIAPIALCFFIYDFRCCILFIILFIYLSALYTFCWKIICIFK